MRRRNPAVRDMSEVDLTGRNKVNAGTIITLTGAALWGMNAVVSKYLMSCGMDTMWMMDFRMITSGLVLLAAGAVLYPSSVTGIWKDRTSVIRLLSIAVFAFGICQLTYYLSIDYSNAGIASALQQTAPVFVLIYVITKERRLPAKAEAVAIPVVVFGSFLYGTTIVGSVKAGVYNLFEPVTAVAASALFLGQSFHITEILGIACILGGITFLTLSERQRVTYTTRN